MKKPEDLFYKFSNFGEYNEFEATGTTINDLKDSIEKGELNYDHTADKKSTALEKVSKKINLKISDEFLPKYLIDNRTKYKDWFHE